MVSILHIGISVLIYFLMALQYGYPSPVYTYLSILLLLLSMAIYTVLADLIGGLKIVQALISAIPILLSMEWALAILDDPMKAHLHTPVIIYIAVATIHLLYIFFLYRPMRRLETT